MMQPRPKKTDGLHEYFNLPPNFRFMNGKLPEVKLDTSSQVEVDRHIEGLLRANDKGIMEAIDQPNGYRGIDGLAVCVS